MWPYWLTFMICALAAVAARPAPAHPATGVRPVGIDGTWLMAIIGLSLLIGFRIEVGADWVNYVRYVFEARYAPISSVLQGNDPGYEFLNWISARYGWDIFGVNLIGGAIFSTGLAVFCRSLPRPWLALAVAVPYLVIVVAMGYSRQGIALGLAMIGLVAMTRRRSGWFIFWVLLGAMFHKSAVILLPIAAVTTTTNRKWTALWVVVAAVLGYFLLLQESVEEFRRNYLETEIFKSQGAAIRLLMNALPAAMALWWRRRFLFNTAENRLWLCFAVISLGLFAIFVATQASTAVDRVALYMLPLQLVVFSHLPEVIGRRGERNEVIVVGILLYYAAVQFVWLNFAAHSQAWLPYRSLLFER